MGNVVLMVENLDRVLAVSERNCDIVIMCQVLRQNIQTGTEAGILAHFIARAVRPVDFACYSVFLKAEDIPQGKKIREAVKLIKEHHLKGIIKKDHLSYEGYFTGLSLPSFRDAYQIDWSMLLEKEVTHAGE
jgi:hypothetical protein